MVCKLKRKIGLVPNWKKSWKWASVQISTFGLILFSVVDIIQPMLTGLPRHILEDIPHGSSITIALFALNIVGRLIRFHPKEDFHES